MSTISDSEIFKKAMQDVVPLKQGDRVATPKVPNKPLKVKQPETRVEENIYIAYHEPVYAHTQLSYLKPNVDAKLLRQLKAGKIKPEREIDLHGTTVTQAQALLLQVLQSDSGLRSVLIVHGKGKQAEDEPAKLKSLVNQVLRSLPQVLAFCSARANEGGEGAVYVLLKRSK